MDEVGAHRAGESGQAGNGEGTPEKIFGLAPPAQLQDVHRDAARIQRLAKLAVSLSTDDRAPAFGVKALRESQQAASGPQQAGTGGKHQDGAWTRVKRRQGRSQSNKKVGADKTGAAADRHIFRLCCKSQS